MAISKKGLRKIQVSGEDFYWRVRKKISHDEAYNEQLGIPIQHESGGQLLIAYVGYGRSKDYGRESLKSITPSIIKECILTAIDLGWQFDKKEKPISLVNGKLTTDTKSAKWEAD